MKYIEHCKTCGGAYDRRKVKRQFGPLPSGYCSAYCYTRDVVLKTKEKDNAETSAD